MTPIDDLALALSAMVEAARGIDDYGWLPKNDYLAFRAALAGIEGSKPFPDHDFANELTMKEKGWREAAFQVGYNRGADEARAPLDVERLAVVAAARALRERLTIDPGNVVSWGEWDTLDEALAKLGAKP